LKNFSINLEMPAFGLLNEQGQHDLFGKLNEGQANKIIGV